MKRNKPRTLRIGEISNATLNPEDLIPSYLWELERLRLTRPERKTVTDVRSAYDAATDNEDDDYFSEDAHEDVNALADILENHVPPYAYFGSLEGDGACIGAWLSHGSIEDAISEGEIWRQDGSKDDEASKVPGWRYRLVVSDHGNMSLYGRNGREVWSVV